MMLCFNKTIRACEPGEPKVIKLSSQSVYRLVIRVWGSEVNQRRILIEESEVVFVKSPDTLTHLI